MSLGIFKVGLTKVSEFLGKCFERLLSISFGLFIIVLGYAVSVQASEEVKNEGENLKDERKSLLEGALYDFGSEKYDCSRIGQLFSEDLNLYSHAHFYRGIAFYKGICVSENLEMAFKEFRQGAKLGHLDASYFMALMYYTGVGVKQDVDYANGIFKVLLRYEHKKTLRLVEKLRDEQLVNEDVLKDALMENMIDVPFVLSPE